MNFSISHALYVHCKTNYSSICRDNIDLVSINCRGHHDANFPSLLLSSLPSHGSATWTVEAKESVRIKDTQVKFSKWREKHETQKNTTNIKDTLQELTIESSSKLRSIKFSLCVVSELSSRFTENITLTYRHRASSI